MKRHQQNIQNNFIQIQTTLRIEIQKTHTIRVRYYFSNLFSMFNSFKKFVNIS